MPPVRDKVIFSLPEDPEMMMAAMAAVQDYVFQLDKQVQNQIKNSNWELEVYSPNKSMDFLKPAFDERVKFVDEYKPTRAEYDFAHKFDPLMAYDFSVKTERHVTDVFGIMIGAAPMEVPFLRKINKLFEYAKGTKQRVMVLPCPQQKELVELIDLHHPEVDVRAPQDNWTTRMPGVLNELVQQAELVIGPRGVGTYLAASYNRWVLEMYPTGRHKGWLAKWAGKRYQMIYGDDIPTALVWRALEGIWERWVTSFLSLEQAQEGGTQTEQQLSSAESAVGPS